MKAKILLSQILEKKKNTQSTEYTTGPSQASKGLDTEASLAPE